LKISFLDFILKTPSPYLSPLGEREFSLPRWEGLREGDNKSLARKLCNACPAIRVFEPHPLYPPLLDKERGTKEER
jgi:hypothetical protein